MKKEFRVEMDVTMGLTMYIQAESEEDAKKKVMERITMDTLYHLKNGWFVNCDITDIEETTED